VGCSRSTSGNDDWDDEAEEAFLAALEERMNDPRLVEGSMTIEEAFGVDAKCARRLTAHRPVRYDYGEPQGRGRLKTFRCGRRHAL
jgi:hypothetical protein